MKTIITLTTIFLFTLLSIAPSYTQDKGVSVRVGVMMEPKQKSIQGIPAKTVVPALTIETARNVVRNFAIGAEVGFGLSELEYKSTTEGAKSQVLLMTVAVKGILQADVLEKGRVYGGVGLGYHKYHEAGVSHPDFVENTDPSRNLIPFLFAGGQFHFGNGFGVFAEGGMGKTKSNNKKQYFKLGLVFTY